MITENIDNVVLCFGEHQITGNNCMVKNFSMNIDNNIEQIHTLAGKEFTVQKINPYVEIELTLVCSDINTIFNTDFNSKKLRNKSIDDASVAELLFAVRQKLK